MQVDYRKIGNNYVLLNPELRGKPIAVGYDTERGVVSTG